jgi:hypothetical protein
LRKDKDNGKKAKWKVRKETNIRRKDITVASEISAEYSPLVQSECLLAKGADRLQDTDPARLLPNSYLLLTVHNHLYKTSADETASLNILSVNDDRFLSVWEDKLVLVLNTMKIRAVKIKLHTFLTSAVDAKSVVSFSRQAGPRPTVAAGIEPRSSSS